jgi:hypothetical protein
MAKLSVAKLAVRVPLARSYLVKVARREELTTYGEAQRAIGTNRRWIGDVLDELNQIEHHRGHPLISVLVTLDNNGPTVPSDGFYKLARRLKAEYQRSTDHEIFETERNATWSHPW